MIIKDITCNEERINMSNKFYFTVCLIISLCNPLNSVLASEFAGAIDMWEEPRHQLVFSMGNIRLVMVNIPPGDTSLLHKHDYATSYVVIEDALMTSRDSDASWSSRRARSMRPVGTLVDRHDYFLEPFAHQVRNVSTNTFRVLGLVNMAPGSKQDKSSGANGSADLLENDWFKEHRLELEAEQLSEQFSFVNPIVAIQVSNGPGLVRNQHSPKTVAGAWSYHRAAEVFQFRNPGKEKLEMLLLELK